MIIQNKPYDFPIEKEFPGRKLLIGFEGSSIWSAEKDGKYFLISSEGSMMDFLIPGEDDDLMAELVKVYEFDSELEREQYIEKREWKTMQSMGKRPSITGAIRNFLGSQPALTVVTCREIYFAVQQKIPGVLYHTVREAVQRVALGSKNARRRNTRCFYAIYLHLPEIRTVEIFDDAYFTLPEPGIDKPYFENMGNPRIKQIQDELAAVYGKETIRYWGNAAQYRSVDFISPGVAKLVKQRHNKRCIICSALAARYVNANKPIPESLQAGPSLTLCHIISRQSLFWQALLEMHQSLFQGNISIFTDEGVKELRRKLTMPAKESTEKPTLLARLHSSDEFIVYLCGRHDKIVQSAIKI